MHDINRILQLSDSFEKDCQGLNKLAFIRKLPSGKYRVLSESGKNLGTYDSRSAAEKRLKQVEYFKHVDKNDADDKSIDLTDIDDFSFSAVMRKMRQNASKEQVRQFLGLFKKCFDKAVKEKLQEPEKVALQNSLVKFNKIHAVKLDKDLVKNAAISELGDPSLVGKYLADIVKFTLHRIEPDKREKAKESLRKKFYAFNADELAQREMPTTSAIGQSITFVKHVLFNHSPFYIREVLNHLVRNL